MSIATTAMAAPVTYVLTPLSFTAPPFATQQLSATLTGSIEINDVNVNGRVTLDETVGWSFVSTGDISFAISSADGIQKFCPAPDGCFSVEGNQLRLAPVSSLPTSIASAYFAASGDLAPFVSFYQAGAGKTSISWGNYPTNNGNDQRLAYPELNSSAVLGSPEAVNGVPEPQSLALAALALALGLTAGKRRIAPRHCAST